MDATLNLLNLAGAIALLLWGVQMVQSGVQRAFWSELRRFLGHALDNRIKAAAAGLGVTAILESSTATGLMIASFAGAGFVALVPALAVMLGANVGTTLIVQALSFNVSRLSPLLLLAGLAMFRTGYLAPNFHSFPDLPDHSTVRVENAKSDRRRCGQDVPQSPCREVVETVSCELHSATVRSNSDVRPRIFCSRARLAGRISRRHGGGAVRGCRDARGANVGPISPYSRSLCVGASAAVYLQSPDLVKERVRPGEGEQDRVHSARSEPAHVCAIAARRPRRRAAALVRNRTARAANSRPGRVRDGHGIDHLGHAGQPFLLAGGALAARPGPASSCVGTLPAGAPPRLLGRAAVAAKCRLLARLLDCHGADPAHGAVDGPSHLDRGTHARPVRSPATWTTCGKSGPGSFQACGECRMKVLPCLILTLSDRSPS